MPMPARLLRYGIHLLEGKDGRRLTDDSGIVSFAPKMVHIPVPAGSGVRITASVGDEVLLGRMLAEPEAAQAVAVCASVSGRVVSIGTMETPSGPETCISIENNRRSRPAAGLPRRTRLGGADIAQSLDPAEIRRMMRDCGALRMDGTGRPLHPDFEPDEANRPIEYVLVDACESEPYLTSVHAQLRENAIQAVSAARLLARAAGHAVPVLCLPDDRPAAIQALRIAVEGTDVRISILRNVYPLGGERTIVRAALGVEIPAGGRASDVGAIVVSAAAAFALHDAAKTGMPVLRRIVTVSGNVGDPHNVLVPFGTPVGELVAFCGGMTDASDRLIAGGPMTGHAVVSPDTPVTASTPAVLALPDPGGAQTPCIRCGECVHACPERLLPFRIDDAIESGDPDSIRRLHPDLCTGCGACSYVCPAKRRLAPRILAAAGGTR
ncbi:MAG: RnfABCDGE type electron transport complex subunit C [Clostridia bacterium]|nr:RnfABCDGE type electron transport complex subunit C [Clostridia bacterium]